MSAYWLSRLLWPRLFAVACSRAPDYEIGDKANPYLRRWWIIPRNRVCNVYLHQVRRSDDDRALHDHPWWNVSLVLSGWYREITIQRGGIEQRTVRRAGDFKFRRATAAHRLEVGRTGCWTLFITGPRLRSWGFHCPKVGWVRWQDFCAPGDSSLVGRGCGEA